MNILLIEDNPSSQALVKRSLAATGCGLHIAESAVDAVKLLRETEIHLIILDMGLPDQDGLDLCAQLQGEHRTRHIPIVVLTGREEISSKIAAFSIGVDDYIVKPFSPLEFRARIEARLKKIVQSGERDEVLVRGELRLNVPTQKCYRTEDGRETDLGLTALEFKLLYQLARREEHVLSRDQILNLVWGESSEVLDRTVDAHVSVLRKKLGTLAHYVQAAHGQGYCFSVKAAKPAGKT